MVKLKYIGDVIKLLVAYFISSILKLHPNNRDIWLIGERKSEARDNGYHLFKYIRENHKNDKVYYIINKKSKDLEKIESLGNIIYSDTFKHYLYYSMSNKLIMAHLGSCVPDSPVCWKVEEKKLINHKKAFIQHGITKELIPSLMYENTKADLFICGSRPEYDFVKSKFGYKKENVKYTGFARFDNLHNFKEKNQILIMPTWRSWIQSTTWRNDNIEQCKEAFVKTEYYKVFNSLINNEELIDFIHKQNILVIFYPHYEMQEYVDLFENKSTNIVIATKEDYDVQELLKESKLLITDYSSVGFDFGYMRKPVVYYQFDSERYYAHHYLRGYFEYEKDGFGPVVKYESDLINIIKNSDNFKFFNLYNERSIATFSLYDNMNCQRIYNEIKNK